MLFRSNREIIIEDLNSTNGVLVNGRKVTRHVLSDGDLLTIGETNFQCRLRPSSRATEIPKDPAVIGMNSSGPTPVAAQPADSGSSEPSNPADSRVGD